YQRPAVMEAEDGPDVMVRLFLSEESPSQVGLGAQDHLQAKAPWSSHSNNTGVDDNLPPGFEAAHPANILKNKLSQIPLAKWNCPSRFVLDVTWQVVAGEESKEIEAQNQRKMRVLEAIYPRPSAIPPNPSFPMDTEGSDPNDQSVPAISITAIEDEDSTTDTSGEYLAPANVPMNIQSQHLMPGPPPSSEGNIPNFPNQLANANPNPLGPLAYGVELDVVAAASAAFTAITRSNEQGSMIDPDLLFKILSNPKLIEKCVTEYGTPQNLQPMSNPPGLSPVTSSNPPPVQINRTEFGGQTLAAPSNGPFYPQLNGIGLAPIPRPPPPIPIPVPSSATNAGPPAKDMSYYKSLIQQHGGERQETQEQVQQYGKRQTHHPVGLNQERPSNPKPRELKPKIMKPCIYFNSSKGCRHGVNCAYQHDASLQQRISSMPEAQSAKRMKVDREITGL
ncbi:hypothetical protein RJ641_028902, partial [Dillenia turbinata]